MCESNKSGNNKVIEEWKDAPGAGAEILFQPLEGPMTLWREEPCCSSVFLEDCLWQKGRVLKHSWRTASCGKLSHRRSKWNTVFLRRHPMLDHEKRVGSKEREEERAAETVCNELIETPAHHAAKPLNVRGQRNWVQSWTGKEGKGGGKLADFLDFLTCSYFVFSYSTIDNKLIFPSRVCFSCNSLSVLILTHELFVLFFSLLLHF